MAIVDDIFDDNIFFLIKMPLESDVEFCCVNVEGDNINLAAADVDSFDVVAGRICGSDENKNKEQEDDDGLGKCWRRDINYVCDKFYCRNLSIHLSHSTSNTGR